MFKLAKACVNYIFILPINISYCSEETKKAEILKAPKVFLYTSVGILNTTRMQYIYNVLHVYTVYSSDCSSCHKVAKVVREIWDCVFISSWPPNEVPIMNNVKRQRQKETENCHGDNFK